jgi:hypothetical protein
MFWGIFNLGCLHWTGVDMNKALKLIFLEAKQSAMLTHTAEGFPVVCMEPQLWKRLREAMEDAMAPQLVQQEPVAVVETLGGYPDESRHEAKWLVPYRALKDGDKLYTAPPQRTCEGCGKVAKP